MRVVVCGMVEWVGRGVGGGCGSLGSCWTSTRTHRGQHTHYQHSHRQIRMFLRRMPNKVCNTIVLTMLPAWFMEKGVGGWQLEQRSGSGSGSGRGPSERVRFWEKSCQFRSVCVARRNMDMHRNTKMWQHGEQPLLLCYTSPLPLPIPLPLSPLLYPPKSWNYKWMATTTPNHCNPFPQDPHDCCLSKIFRFPVLIIKIT